MEILWSLGGFCGAGAADNGTSHAGGRRLHRVLRRKLDLPRTTDIVREALTILNWAVQERERNRVILSADPSGQSVERLAMPVLDKLAR